MGSVLSQSLNRHDEQADRPTASTILQIVEHLSLARSEGYRIHNRIGAAQSSNHLRRFDLASMIACLADKQNGMAIVVVACSKQLRGITNSIEGSRARAIARGKLTQRTGHSLRIRRKIAK